MIDSLNKDSYSKSKEERDNHETSNNASEYGQGNDSNNNVMLGQVILYFAYLSGDLESMSKGLPYNYLRISESLRCIRTTLDEVGFPYDLFAKFQVHESLFKIINLEKFKGEDIFNSLYIIGRYYCYSPLGCQLIKEKGFAPSLLQYIRDDEMEPFYNPILAGIGGLLKYDDDEKSLTNYIFSNQIDSRLLYIYEHCTENPVILEITVIIKFLIKNQTNEEFVANLLAFMPLLKSLLDLQNDALTKLSVQSFRHLIYNFPNVKPEVGKSGFSEKLYQLLISENVSFGILKASVYFYRYYCSGNEEIARTLFTNEFLTKVYNIINNDWYDTKSVSYILIDIENIMLNSKSLIFSVIDTDFFKYLIEKSQKSSFYISIECSIILSQIILAGDADIIANVIESGFLENLEGILTSEKSGIIILGLDVLNHLFNIIKDQNDSKIAEEIRNQSWIPDTLSDLCQHADENVARRAIYLNEQMVPTIFNGEEGNF